MKLFKCGLGFLLTIIMVFSLCSVAIAADNESILTSIGHESTDTVTLSGSMRDVVLTVPFNYSQSNVDLSNGLNIAYDDSEYEYVVATGSVATVDSGIAVPLTITYNGINDPEGALKSQTVYTVRVVRAVAKGPEFSGVIHKAGVCPGVIGFSDTNFTEKYKQNDGTAMSYVSITGSNLVVGKLKLPGGDYVFGSPISVADLANLTFVSSSSGTVSYDIKAYTGTAWETASLVGTSVLTITTSALAVPSINSMISKSVPNGSSLALPLSTFKSCYALNDGTLNSIEITPTNTGYGTWYKVTGTSASVFTGATVFTESTIDNLSFKGSAVGTATFKWRVSNEAGFSAYGTGSINVSSLVLTLNSYTASSSMISGATRTLHAADFVYTPTDASVTYVKISTIPTGSDGYLYLTTDLAKNDTFGYPAIVANKALSAGAIIPYNYLNYLSMATKSAATSSSIYFTWTATTDSLVSKATWASTATYTVGFVTAGTISYSTDLNTPLKLDAAKFSDEFRYKTGYTLSYVTFILPAATSGKLYYNYDISTGKGTAVSATTKYYNNASPNISSVTFVPTTGYVGTVNSAYSAYTADGVYITGTLKIDVSNSAGGIVSYTTDKNTAIQVDASNFKTTFKSITGEDLSYVKFTLPSSSYGNLYYNYKSSRNYDAMVSSSTKYYMNDSLYLSYISFVPHYDYIGMVNIIYTGYDTDGNSYKGKLKINVVDSPGGIVAYSAETNTAVKLSADDFSDEFITSSGSILSYVKFTLPAATVGTLYYDYSQLAGTGTKIAGNTNYYNGTNPDISDLTFVPIDGYTGTVTIAYAAYTESGSTYAGKLKITIGSDADVVNHEDLTYKTNVNTTVTFDGDDFNTAFRSKTDENLYYVKFTLPSSAYGKLYYNYTSSSTYGSKVSDSTKYYRSSSPKLSDVTFVPADDYTGKVTISYSGYDSSGDDYNCEVIIYVNPDSTNAFTDVGESYAWASEAIDYLYNANVINGTGNNIFSPQNKMSRGDFMLMVNKAFKLSANASTNFSDVTTGSYYYDAIATAKALSVVEGNGDKFYPNAAISRQDAMVILVRALSASGKTLAVGSSNDLSVFYDSSRVSDYALEAVATLVKAGIVTGNNGSLNPRGNITRAEMSVILYRIMNM